MDTKALKELKALLKVLQDHGVTEYDTEGLKLKLEPKRESLVDGAAAPLVDDAPDLVDDALMLYSAPELSQMLAAEDAAAAKE